MQIKEHGLLGPKNEDEIELSFDSTMMREEREEYDTYEILKVDERKELRSELRDPTPSDFGPRLVL